MKRKNRVLANLSFNEMQKISGGDCKCICSFIGPGIPTAGAFEIGVFKNKAECYRACKSAYGQKFIDSICG